MDLAVSWAQLPVGARAAIEQQWIGIAAGALACGAAVVDAEGRVIAAGRNHAYDPRGEPATLPRYPLQHCRLAHAELNALALVATEVDHAALTLWATQHPCAMCAAAARFVGLGRVCFIADDPSDDAPEAVIVASRGGMPYERSAGPEWATICNLLFLYTSAVLRGADARNLRLGRTRWPRLVDLVLELARDDELGRRARAHEALLDALQPHAAAIEQAAL
ncbi:MAG TPA: deaminase [Ideonella sp.]|jgi:tRNA(Arg) A34 adenosine deaminase TadA|nr:deaminase [Ideonella sp.]